MKFYTWCDDKDDKRLIRLMRSANMNGISVEVIGDGRDIHEGGYFEGKNTWLYEKVCKLPCDEIVVCTDAFDVIYLANETEIEQKFLAMNSPILYGTDYFFVGCWSRDRKLMESLAKDAYYKYLNAGVVIGYAKTLKSMIDTLREYKYNKRPHIHDQGLITRYYIKNPTNVALDYKCNILWTETFSTERLNPRRGKLGQKKGREVLRYVQEEYFDKNFIGGRLKNQNTDTFPCILHMTSNKYLSPTTDYLFDRIYLDNPFKFFDEIYCINLDSRKDRWKLAQREFEKLGILDKVKRFSAVDNMGGKRGCFESHMKIIQMAKEKNLKNVFIFEDDVAVLPCYSHEKFEKSINFLKDQTWEFFYMGGFQRRICPRKEYNRLKEKYDNDELDATFDYIMKADSVGWNQSYAINSNIFDRIINDYEGGLWEMLEERWKGRPGRTDRYYQHHLKPKAYVCVPSFTTQYDVVSDLQRTRTNRSLRLNPEDNI